MDIGPTINAWIRQLYDLFIPNICALCAKEIDERDPICLFCQSQLPLTFHWNSLENDFTERLGSRIYYERGLALYYVQRNGRVKELVKFLKYKNRKDIGYWMGRQLGYRIMGISSYFMADYLIPVPLHTNKLKERGYNQSASIALGISSVIKVPLLEDNLYRVKESQSQTRMNRVERIANIESVFALRNASVLKNKTIVLVDDVLTTGATLEACAGVLRGIEGLKIQLLTIGLAEMQN
jgi:ComF family protein